jgi:hypothetical protein
MKRRAPAREREQGAQPLGAVTLELLARPAHARHVVLERRPHLVQVRRAQPLIRVARGRGRPGQRLL